MSSRPPRTLLGFSSNFCAETNSSKLKANQKEDPALPLLTAPSRADLLISQSPLPRHTMKTPATDGPPDWPEPSEQQGLLHQGWEEGMGNAVSFQQCIGQKAERKLTFLLVFGSQCQLWSLSPQILTLLLFLLLPMLANLGPPASDILAPTRSQERLCADYIPWR